MILDSKANQIHPFKHQSQSFSQLLKALHLSMSHHQGQSPQFHQSPLIYLHLYFRKGNQVYLRNSLLEFNDQEVYITL